MHLIKNVRVEGFWGTHNLDVPIDSDVTFFIGQNGTGKTTLINLIASVLVADFRTLERTEFEKITITLVDRENVNLEPNLEEFIELKKSKKNRRQFDVMEYRIDTINIRKTTGKAFEFSFDEVEEQYLLRHVPYAEWAFHERAPRRSANLRKLLQETVFVNWLSIHRVASQDRRRDDRNFDSTVDLKLETLSNELIKYFSSVSKLKDEEIRKFQEYIFISLLEIPPDTVLTKDTSEDTINEKFLKDIFQELHVNNDNLHRLIKNFLSLAPKRKKELKGSFTTNEIGYFFNLSRLESVTKQWRELQGKLETIFSQRDKFIKIMNDMLRNKEININNSNEIFFKTNSNKLLSPQMLSSGEKQLLILLSESLLQREMQSIFITDEPELSLHLYWQEKLIPSIRALNPNAQIIAATHSPEIVGRLAEKALDMEDIIK